MFDRTEIDILVGECYAFVSELEHVEFIFDPRPIAIAYANLSQRIATVSDDDAYARLQKILETAHAFVGVAANVNS